MYVIIGSHCVPLEGKFLLIALVIVRIALKLRYTEAEGTLFITYDFTLKLPTIRSFLL
jgi:hypothetical protein